MRAVALAAVFSGALLSASAAGAQVSYVYGNGAYPIYSGGLVGGGFGYGGVYGGGGFGYGSLYGPQSYGWQNGGSYPMGYPMAGYYPTGGYYPMRGSFGRPYIGPALQPLTGMVNGGLTYLPQTPINNNPYYTGYTRYAQYGLRRAGGGRIFGTYVPRDYRVYQPRPGGMFDR